MGKSKGSHRKRRHSGSSGSSGGGDSDHDRLELLNLVVMDRRTIHPPIIPQICSTRSPNHAWSFSVSNPMQETSEHHHCGCVCYYYMYAIKSCTPPLGAHLPPCLPHAVSPGPFPPHPSHQVHKPHRHRRLDRRLRRSADVIGVVNRVDSQGQTLLHKVEI